MKLLKARISSYKSIVEAELQVDPLITILVGPNEGGKTNLLKAIQAFNPDEEFTDSLVCQSSEAYREGYFPEVQFLFGHFSQTEKDEIVRAWNERNGAVGQVGSNEGGPSASSAEFSPDPKNSLSDFHTLTVTKQGNLIEDYHFHVDSTALIVENQERDERLKEKLLAILPRVLYFDDITLLRGESKIDDLRGEDPAF